MSAKLRLAVFGALMIVAAAGGHASPSDNKDTAINAMQDLFSKQDPSAVDRYFGGSPYTQHNMRIPNGIDALKELAKQATTWTGVHTDIIRGLAEGNLVVLQSAYFNLVNSQQTAVAFDLFRFNEQGKIVEHWDALEHFPGPSPAGRVAYEGSTEINDLDKTQANRRTVQRYLKTVVIDRKTNQTRRFLDKGIFIDHGLSETMLIDVRKNDPMPLPPNILSDLRYVKMHKTVAQGNFVFVQGEARLSPTQIVEVYDLFRLERGKLVEHWNVIQPVIPREQWANKNGPF